MRKSVLLGLVVALLIVGGASAYYFGYYTNPSVIYSQALSNTAAGYSKLLDYSTLQQKANYKGYSADGSYTVGVGNFATDGKLSLKGDNNNVDSTIDINIGASRLGFEARAINGSNAKLPDVYFKASGLGGLSKLAGTDLTSFLKPYDNQWIQVDKSILQQLESAGASSTGSASGNISTPTKDQIMDELTAFGQVNSQDIFTADKTKAVFVMTKQVGRETVDGHSTYHYQVTPNKANLKKYITAQRDALKSSKLYDWIKKNHYENYVGLAYDSLEQSADNLKTTRPVDIWVDTAHRIIYKVRIADPSNPTTNYADVGLNYTGGSSYPFFVNIYNQQADSKITALLGLTLDTQTNATSLSLSVKSTGGDVFNVKANLDVKPTTTAPSITAPTGAKPLSGILNQLGLGSYLGMLGSGSLTTDSSGDAAASADLHHECTLAEENYVNNGTPIPAKCDALFQ